jgi:hypothetical protein
MSRDNRPRYIRSGARILDRAERVVAGSRQHNSLSAARPAHLGFRLHTRTRIIVRGHEEADRCNPATSWTSVDQPRQTTNAPQRAAALVARANTGAALAGSEMPLCRHAAARPLQHLAGVLGVATVRARRFRRCRRLDLTRSHWRPFASAVWAGSALPPAAEQSRRPPAVAWLRLSDTGSESGDGGATAFVLAVSGRPASTGRAELGRGTVRSPCPFFRATGSSARMRRTLVAEGDPVSSFLWRELLAVARSLAR